LKGDCKVNNVVKVIAVCVAVLLMASPAWAQAPTAPGAAPIPLIDLTGSFGAGLVVMGAAYGIGRLAAAALESMARQPEVAGNIQTAMIIAAALIEGFTFFALYICMTGV
jgi:F-type H+-transporting ATPase subunit c